jgi:hypothetical protein
MNRTPEQRWSLRWDSPAAVADARRAVEAGMKKGWFSPHDYAVAMARMREAERRYAERN